VDHAEGESCEALSIRKPLCFSRLLEVALAAFRNSTFDSTEFRVSSKNTSGDFGRKFVGELEPRDFWSRLWSCRR